MFHQLRFALRALLRRRIYSALVVVTLALGIGAATATFSALDAALLRPLPYRDAKDLLNVLRVYPEWRGDPMLGRMWDRVLFSYQDYVDWSATQTAFATTGAWASASATLTDVTGAAEHVSIVRASATTLDVLGVRPSLGRFFLPGEDRPGGARLAVISRELWETRYGSSLNAVGQQLSLDGIPHEIVGVLPAGLDLSNRGRVVHVWVPAGDARTDANRGSTAYFVVGRLRSGVTLERASDEAARIVAALERSGTATARIAPWESEITRASRMPLTILFAASMLLLLLTSANVATLQVGEAQARAPEFATRGALGAGRSMIASQVVTEATILGVAGAALGAMVAAAGIRSVLSLATLDVPGLTRAGIDWRVLAFASIVGVSSAVLSALAPLLLLWNVQPGFLARSASVFRHTARNEARTSGALLGVQVALSLVMLVGAGLFARSLSELGRVDPGFSTDRLLFVSLGAMSVNYEDATKSRALFAAAAEASAGIPGVAVAAVGSSIPFSGGNSSRGVEVEGRPSEAGTSLPQVRVSYVMPGFIEALGLRFAGGRSIERSDDERGQRVAVVNETLAQRFWPGESPLGKRIGQRDEWRTVVGVVSDAKHLSLGETTQPMMYVPEMQEHTRFLALLVKLQPGVAASAIIPAVRREVARIDPAVPVTRIETVEELVRGSVATPRFRAGLSSAYAVVASFIAAVGIFGVTSRAVRRQQREIGIRLALGAAPARAIGPTVTHLIVGVAFGVVVGTVAAVAVTRGIAPLLFRIEPDDAGTYAASVGALVVMLAIATWIPSRVVTRVTLASLLRGD